MLITNFNNKKVKQYLDSGKYKKVLLIQHHGLGDAFMFYATCYKQLCKSYPDIQFILNTHLGQQELFGYSDSNVNDYDIAFKFVFPCSQWGSLEQTKWQKCGRVQIGSEIKIQDYKINKEFKSPLIGIHLNSTCDKRINCPKQFAQKLWNQIIAEGLIPIDTHMRHKNDNKRSVIHEFEQCRRIDNIPADINKLMGILSVCRGFAGVSSGNLFCALSVLPPQKILYLKTEFSINRLTRLPIKQIDCRKPYDEKAVHEWIENLKK